jgi:hypothetical protein
VKAPQIPFKGAICPLDPTQATASPALSRRTKRPFPSGTFVAIGGGFAEDTVLVVAAALVVLMVVVVRAAVVVLVVVVLVVEALVVEALVEVVFVVVVFVVCVVVVGLLRGFRPLGTTDVAPKVARPKIIAKNFIFN